MSLRTPTSNDRSFDPAPAGWAVARCFSVIDLGTHLDAKWDKETHLVRIGFELPACLRDDNKPHLVYKRFTLSHHPKSRLRADLESWYGKKFDTNQLNANGGFEMKRLIDRPAFLNIVHSQGEDTTFANIATIGPMPANMDCPPLTTPKVYFDLSEFNASVFESLPDKTKQQIMQSGEYLVMTGKIQDPRTRGAQKSAPPDDDDVPYGNSAPAGNSRPPGGKSVASFDKLDDDIPF